MTLEKHNRGPKTFTFHYFLSVFNTRCGEVKALSQCDKVGYVMNVGHILQAFIL